jgi:hypothetical protein
VTDAAEPRKRVKHYDLPGDAHFLTFSWYHGLKLLCKDRTRLWFLEALEAARKNASLTSGPGSSCSNTFTC